MNDFFKTIAKNRQLTLIVLAALMIVFFALCPAVDIAGKATANGLKIVFNGKGLGFSRLLSVLMILTPVCGLVMQFFEAKIPENIRGNFNLIWSGLSLVMIVLLGIALPDAISLAWGSYLYLILAAAGVALDYYLLHANRK